MKIDDIIELLVDLPTFCKGDKLLVMDHMYEHSLDRYHLKVRDPRTGIFINGVILGSGDFTIIGNSFDPISSLAPDPASVWAGGGNVKKRVGHSLSIDCAVPIKDETEHVDFKGSKNLPYDSDFDDIDDYRGY